MALEVPLGNFNVMPAQAGIHDFLQQAAVGSLSRGSRGAPRVPYTGMTGLVGQRLCGLVSYNHHSQRPIRPPRHGRA
jgi:hypothetical protein